jgi:hypothetical protein
MAVKRKTCPDCKRDLPASMFNKNIKASSGLGTYCKPCTKSRRKRKPPPSLVKRLIEQTMSQLRPSDY